MRRLFIRIILPVLVLVAGGALMAMWLVQRADREMRADLIQQAQLLAQAINVDQVQGLTGTTADVQKPTYQLLKKQLILVRSVYPRCRFIYLAGRKPDGSIVFLVDSEPENSPDLSPPGQPYQEASKPFHAVFDNKTSVAEGPLPDRWGVWVTALAPVFDPQSGAVPAVLGMDIDARDWNSTLARTALPAALLTLALVAVVLLGALLLERRSRPGGSPPAWMRHVETGFVGAVGFTLSLAATWLAYTNVSRRRDDTFAKLAGNQTAAMVERLQGIRDSQLESLAHFYTAREQISAGEFDEFARSLTRNVTVTIWGWAPVVPAGDRDRFEAAARATGLVDFEIWQIDPGGKRVRATGRDVYYPVFQVAPAKGNEPFVGRDSASEPLRRAALEEAIRTGLATGTDPVVVPSATGGQKGMVVYRPIFARNEPGRLRGLVGALVRMENLLRTSALLDRVPLMELTLLHPDAPPETLAATWSGARPVALGRPATRPLFAFGKVFLVTTHPGPEFALDSPLRTGGLALMFGLMLSGTVATITRLTLRQRVRLERLVAERTAELRQSEESYRNQFANSSAVMLLVDPASGAIIDANEAALIFYGHPRERLLAMRISDINVKAAAELRQITESIVQGQRNQFEFQHRLADGSIRDVAVASSAIQYGGRTILHSIIQDITERKRVALELELAHHSLQERVKEMKCLYAVTKLTSESHGSIDELLRIAVGLIPPGWQYPEITRARITWDAQEFATAGFLATAWMQSTDIVVAGQPIGKIEVCYLEERPFMKEERVLLNNLGAQIGAAIERRRAEGKLQQLSSIIEQAPLSVIITDLTGVIEYVNPKYCTVTGYSREEMIGQAVQAFRSEETPPEVYRDLWSTITGNRVWTGELYSRRKNGESYLENVVAAPLVGEDGRTTHYVTLKDDITAQKRSEAELAKERELSGLKSQFISVASHEFRTPLAAAVGSLELLERHAAKLTEAKRLELLARIKASLGRLTTIMDDVLQLSRADSGRVKVNRITANLVQLVQDLIREVETGDRQKHLFVFRPSGRGDAVPVDTNLVNHIVSNLLGNAVRYSPEGKTISVGLDIAEQGFTLTVADEGIGVPEAERERVFEPFARGSNVGQINGTGLGLNIVKRYTELMGGHIALLPAERGATFRVEIPFHQTVA